MSGGRTNGSVTADADVKTDGATTSRRGPGGDERVDTATVGSADEGLDRGTGRWTPSDLLWLLDGDWEVTTLANRIVATREGVDVAVARRGGVVRAATRVDGHVVDSHESSRLTEALAGVRDDLGAEGV